MVLLIIIIIIILIEWANALVPPTPILRAMLIRCYPMLAYMFPYLSFVRKLFSSDATHA